MYYYNVEDDLVTKYGIELNEEKLKGLREEIIENCSLVEHVSKKDIGLINYEDGSIRNLSREKVGTLPSSMPHIPTENIFLVNYDKYEYPELVYLIDKLLSGDTSVINTLQNPNFDELEKNQKRPVIRELEYIINNSDNLDSQRQSELLSLNQQKLLKISSSREYYSKVLMYVIFEKKSQIPLEYLEATVSFFDNSISSGKSAINNQVKELLLSKNNLKV